MDRVGSVPLPRVEIATGAATDAYEAEIQSAAAHKVTCSTCFDGATTFPSTLACLGKQMHMNIILCRNFLHTTQTHTEMLMGVSIILSNRVHM